jgi:anti-sigma factor RsiW
MECSSPPPLTDDQISAALDQAATADVTEHLARCPSCAARLEQAGSAERALRSNLFRWDCPPPQLLAEYHLGSIAADQQRAIARHLDQCARCTEEIGELVLFMRDEAPTVEPPAPSSVRRPPMRGWSLGRLLPRAPALALRGSSAEPLMFEADGGVAIFLEVRPAAGGQAELHGQLVADDQDGWIGALVEIRQAGALRATATIDDLGTFQTPALPLLPSELRLMRADGQALLLPEFELSASGGQ